MRGVCVYPLVYAGCYFRDFNINSAILTGIIGAIVMLAMALSVNVGGAGVKRREVPRLQLQTG